jgi:hypothetical protein
VQSVARICVIMHNREYLTPPTSALRTPTCVDYG